MKTPLEPSFPAPAAPVTLSPQVEQVKTLLQVAEDALKMVSELRVEQVKTLLQVAEDALKMVSELRAEKAAIREAYYQYQFFADGYANGSASISEVRAAHDKFTALL